MWYSSTVIRVVNLSEEPYEFNRDHEAVTVEICGSGVSQDKIREGPRPKPAQKLAVTDVNMPPSSKPALLMNELPSELTSKKREQAIEFIRWNANAFAGPSST